MACSVLLLFPLGRRRSKDDDIHKGVLGDGGDDLCPQFRADSILFAL